MQGVNVKSEIGNLKKVILHRPGDELLNLTPNTLEELLFDDIPFLPVAQEEHDAFAKILRDEGVEVVYLEDLMAEVLDAKPSCASSSSTSGSTRRASAPICTPRSSRTTSIASTPAPRTWS